MVSGGAPTPVPADNADLLAAIAAGVDVGRSDERRFVEAKRGVVLALARSTVLLLAAADGEPMCRPTPSRLGGVMLAFTDREAADAWVAGQHPAAHASRFVTSSGFDRDVGRKVWLERFARCSALGVVLNAAGPLGTIVYANEVRKLRPRRSRRSDGSDVQHPWLDLAARAGERARLAGSVGTADGASAFGSLLWAAERRFLAGRRLAHETDLDEGARLMLLGCAQWGLAGDPYRAIDGLLEVGQLLLEEHREGTVLGEVGDSLANLSAAAYRSEDVGRFAPWASS
jgi:hypothetical protein